MLERRSSDRAGIILFLSLSTACEVVLEKVLAPESSAAARN